MQIVTVMFYMTCISKKKNKCDHIDYTVGIIRLEIWRIQMSDNILNAIMAHVNCTRKDAINIWHGIGRVRSAYYKAFFEEGNLVICQDGYTIHKLNISQND